MDYNALTMRFMWEGKLIHLIANHSSLTLKISLSQLRRIQSIEGVSKFFYL